MNMTMNTMNKMKSKHFSDQAGFTVIELVVVLAVSVAILAGLLVLYNNYYRIYYAQEATARVVSASALTGSELQMAAKQAEAVVESRTVNGTTYQSDSDTVVFQLPAVTGSGSVIPNEHDYIVFNTDGTKLYKVTDAYGSSQRDDGTKLLSDVVGAVNFSYNNGNFTMVDKVDVSIDMELTVRGAANSQKLQQTLFLFNAK